MISLPIDRRGGLAHVCPRGLRSVAFLDKRVLATSEGLPYWIVGFRSDDKAVVDARTHDCSLWYTVAGKIVYATHAVLKKETDQ
jgi:hypothetical protein